MAGPEVGALGLGAEGALRRRHAVAVWHEQFGRQGLFHPVVGFERDVLVVERRPVQHAVQALVDDPARAVGAGDIDLVRIGAGVGRAQAQAQVFGDRASHVDAQLIGVAPLGLFGPGVAGVGRAAPRRGDLAGDDVDDPAHRIRTVERRHRAAHHLDALDHVGRDPVQVLAAQVGAIADVARVADPPAVHQHQGIVVGQAADGDLGHGAGRADAAGHAGQTAQQFAEALNRLTLDLFARDDADRRRGVTHVDARRRGGDDDVRDGRRLRLDFGGARQGGRGGEHGGGHQAEPDAAFGMKHLCPRRRALKGREPPGWGGMLTLVSDRRF
ncbi:hypothetical protein D3C72_406200 [compost metagenome]